jgi:hypothetical protein
MFARLWFLISVGWIALLGWIAYNAPDIARYILPWMLLPFILRLLFRWVVAGEWVRRR